jgi:hypothetical protein
MLDGFELNLGLVGTREDVQMDMTAAEVSGVALRSEYLWGHELETGGVNRECRECIFCANVLSGG